MKKIHLTEEEIIKDMQNVFREHGKLTNRLYTKYGKWSVGTITKVASFNCLKSIALGNKHIHKKNISKEELVEDVLKVMSSVDKLTKDIYLNKGMYSRKPIDRHFGSWNKMLKELKLDINCLINIPEQDLLNDLKRLYEEYNTLSATIVKHHGIYCTEVYQRRFGSFNKAVELAGLPTSQSGASSPTADSMIRICESILKEKAQPEKTFAWLRNPETNRPLYIDAYFEKQNIAFEYDGPQHFMPVKAYGGKDAYIKRQKLDSLKNSLLESHNVKLLRLSWDEPHSREYLIKRLANML